MIIDNFFGSSHGDASTLVDSNGNHNPGRRQQHDPAAFPVDVATELPASGAQMAILAAIGRPANLPLHLLDSGSRLPHSQDIS